MDKGQKGLRTLQYISNHPGGLLGRHHIEKKNVVTQWPSKSILYQKTKPIEAAPTSFRNGQPDAPFFLGLKPFKDRVAITASNGDFTYADLFNRSFYISLEIKKALRNQANQNQAISLICPNGVSYVIGQWAIWMSGNIVVPLSGEHTPETLEYFIKDSKSVLVITANGMLDRVESVAKKLEKPLICVDTDNANQTHEIDFCDSGKSNSSHNLIFNEEIYPKDYPVMMLYLPGDRKNKRAFFDHRDLNDELYYVSNTWNLDENTAMLHTLSLYHTFGIVATLMSPLSVGGSVVILPQFDTLKVWAHLLGLNLGEKFAPRVNYFAGVPKHYELLIKRYEELFHDSKVKNHVLDTCTTRMKTMINGNGYTHSLLDYKTYTKWKKITGHYVKSY